MSLKNILRAPLVAAALCLSTLTLHTRGVRPGGVGTRRERRAGPGRDADAGGRAHGDQGDDRQPLRAGGAVEAG